MKETSMTSRRDFLKSSSAAAAVGFAAPFVLSSQGRAAAVSPGETLKVGLVGCGGRGTGAANDALAADSNVILTAVGDAFADNLQTGLSHIKKAQGDKVKVEPDHQFVGLDAYEKVINSGVDVVILATPPGFRPMHLKAAIDAGKHVFCEKPMAVDAPGVRTVLAAAAEAKKKNLSIVSGFCWRAHLPKRATFGEVLNGGVGEIHTIYSTYNTGPVKDAIQKDPNWNDVQMQLRNWYQLTWLSGDHIAEQAVHSI